MKTKRKGKPGRRAGTHSSNGVSEGEHSARRWNAWTRASESPQVVNCEWIPMLVKLAQIGQDEGYAALLARKGQPMSRLMSCTNA